MADLDVVVIVEAGGNRKWAGSGALKDAFLQGSLKSSDCGVAVEVDPKLSCLVESKDAEGQNTEAKL